MGANRSSISIVIPVYNEEAGIFECLNAIKNQKLKPLEVIIVNNNSSDNTLLIVKEFSFVKVINEHKQGMIHARNAGLVAAKGEIIARIDGDTVINENWTLNVAESLNSPTINNLVGCTGPLYFNDLPFHKLGSNLHKLLYFGIAKIIFHRQVFFGSNMAFRSSYASEIIRNSKTDRDKIHEDIDLTLLLAKYGKVKYNNKMLVGISFRKTAGSFNKMKKHITQLFAFWRYSYYK